MPDREHQRTAEFVAGMKFFPLSDVIVTEPVWHTRKVHGTFDFPNSGEVQALEPAVFCVSAVSLDPSSRNFSVFCDVTNVSRFVHLDAKTIQIPVSQSTHGNALFNLIREVERMRELTFDFNGYGSEAPNEQARSLATEILLASANVKPTRVLPSAQGGVAVYFIEGGKRGDIECLNTGELVATTSDGRQLPDVWEIQPQDIKPTVGKISEFLKR